MSGKQLSAEPDVEAELGAPRCVGFSEPAGHGAPGDSDGVWPQQT